jgi:hypothetical protein
MIPAKIFVPTPACRAWKCAKGNAITIITITVTGVGELRPQRDLVAERFLAILPEMLGV